MSTPRGPGNRGGGRGRGAFQPSLRGASNTRGRVFNNAAQRGSSAPRGPSGHSFRGNATNMTRGQTNPSRNNGFTKQPSRGGTLSIAQSRGNWQERYQALENDRQRERTEAIQRGLIADPDKPRKLAEAITPVGTCQDMCAEFERVERVVQKDVWPEETDPNQSAYSSLDREPDESRMVKKFRRAAAGIEEQLPSDLRPPVVLKQTCDYLFNDVIGTAPSLAKVHHFVWDRTRAIRNDFSIQQVTRPEDLSVAIECYERIARFHILSLHQLALPEKPYDKYDWQQEKEQLDRTLLSLLQYYDDSRGRIALPNEAEFRAYEIIFRLDTPDLENDVQCWPRDVLRNPRVRKALSIYAAGRNTRDLQGPLKPATSHVIAQQDWMRFWNLVSSNGTSYLMACVAERHFNDIRGTALHALAGSLNQRQIGEWKIEEMGEMLALDSNEEVEDFCGRFGVECKPNPAGQVVVDPSPLKGRALPSPTPALQKQMKSMLVEQKRHGRMLPAIINGLSVRQAQEADMVEEIEEDMNGIEQAEENIDDEAQGKDHLISDATDDGESLFIPSSTNAGKTNGVAWPVPHSSDSDAGVGQQSTIFGKPSQQPQGTSSSFGKPSPFAPAGDTKAPSSQTSTSPFTGFKGGEKLDNNAGNGKSKFNFLAGKPDENKANSVLGAPSTAAPKAPSLFAAQPTFAGFNQAEEKKETLLPAENSEKNQSTSATRPAADGSTGFSFGKTAMGNPSTAGFQSNKYQNPFASLPTPSEHSSPVKTAHLPADGPLFAPSKPLKPAAPPSVFTSQPETSSDKKLPTFDFAPKKQPAQPAQPQPASPFATSSDNPKSATAGRFSKPVVPSPLAHSFEPSPQKTFASEAPVKPKVTFQQPSFEQPPPQQATTTPLGLPKSKPSPPQPDFSTIVSRLARDITLEPRTGFLEQYIDFVLGKVITDVQEQVYTERVNAEADEFRHNVLAQRYGKKWRDTCRHQRLAKHGRERRRRAAQRLQEHRSQASENGSVVESDSLLARSNAGSVLGNRAADTRSRRDVIDSMFQQSVNSGRWSRMASEQAKAGSKRSTPAHELEDRADTQHRGHKRFKSVDSVSNNMPVARNASPTTHPADILKRSSFLGFSAAGSAGMRNTTQSRYFKHKALGLQPVNDFANARARKRQHSEMAESAADSTAAKQRPSSSLRRDRSLSTTRALVRKDSPGSTKSARNVEEDDALFARLRAARESLKETASFFQSEVARVDQFSQSVGSQGSTYESPSLERARLEARLRASQPVGGSNDRDVPAYRLRESKFVPRENYAKAIERAREFRESRSGETSRPQSRVDFIATEEPSAPPTAEDRAESEDLVVVETQSSKPAASQQKSTDFDFTQTNGLRASEAPAQSSSAFSNVAPPSSFGSFARAFQASKPSAFDSQAAFDNPFTAFGNTAGSAFSLKPSEISETQDHTIQRSNINATLASSFGVPAAPIDKQPAVTKNEQHSQFQQSSYLNTQDILFIDDDDDDEVQITSVEQPPVNGTSFDQQTELSDDTEDDGEVTHGHANSFAALADDAAEEDSFEWNAEMTAEDHIAGAAYDDEQEALQHNHLQFGEYDDTEEDDGDIEDGDIEDGDEEIFDEEEEEGTEDGAGYSYPPPTAAWNGKTSGSPALAVKGTTETDAIELSD